MNTVSLRRIWCRKFSVIAAEATKSSGISVSPKWYDPLEILADAPQDRHDERAELRERVDGRDGDRDHAGLNHFGRDEIGGKRQRRPEEAHRQDRP